MRRSSRAVAAGVVITRILGSDHPAPPLEMVDWRDAPERLLTWPSVRVAGTPHEQGLAHGNALRGAVRANLDTYFRRFEQEAGLNADEVRRRGALYLEAIGVAHPGYRAGMEGIAEGAGVDLAALAALNVRYEILYVAHGKTLMETDGCTAFAALPESTADGRLLVGQNWDWIPAVKGAVVATEPAEGPRTLAFTEAGIFGGKIGLNEAGLALCVNGMMSTEDDWEGLETPFHARCWLALSQDSLAEAVGEIAKGRRAATANFLLAKAPDEVADVEAAPGDTNVLGPEDGMLVHSNHFVEPDSLEATEAPNPRRWFSCARRDRLDSLLRAARPLDREKIEAALSDHLGDPTCLCRHGEPEVPASQQIVTITAALMDPAAGRARFAEGPPCKGRWADYSLTP